MWRSYLKTAWRNLWKAPLFTLINLSGLITALCSFALIALYLQDEYSYDRYHHDYENTYRLWEELDFEGAGERSSSMQFPVGPALLNDYPHLIEDVVRFFNFQKPIYTIKVEDQMFNQEKVFFTDTGVFKIFNWPLLAGDPETALDKPQSIVLDSELAQKFFGNEDPIGKELIIERGVPLIVTGIMAPVPSQTHFQPKALISFSTLAAYFGPDLQANNWVWNPAWTYIHFKEQGAKAELEAQFPSFIQKYYPDFMRDQTEFSLMPIADIHLESHLEYELEENHHRSDLYILATMALIILIIAIINFTNLATARSTGRAREVGVRKTLGANRSQLIQQFLGESILQSLMAAIITLGLLALVLPLFNSLAQVNLAYADLWKGPAPYVLLSTSILLGFLAGLYPAFYLSAFEPQLVLKGGAVKRGKNLLGKVLVVFQFVLSAVLIIATLTVNEQFSFMQEKDLGFDEEQVVVMSTKPKLIPQIEAIRAELLKSPNIEAFTVMNDIIGEDHNVFEYNYGGMPAGQWQYLPTLVVNEDFVKTMGLEIIAGRDLNRDIKSDDTAAVLVNETLVREMGWGSPEEALGQRMTTPRGRERVVGVLKDFHYVSLKEPIRPFVLDMIAGGFWIQEFAIRIKAGKTEAALADLKEVWQAFAPEFPFDYFFLEDRLDRLYENQDTLRKLVALFSLIALIISAIGLFALSSLSIAQRTKEIGIRKILGAEAPQLIQLLSKEFLSLVIIALLIASPLSFWLLNNWLQSFAYHIDFSWWNVALAAILALAIALLSMSYHLTKVLRSDPVQSIRYE